MFCVGCMPEYWGTRSDPPPPSRALRVLEGGQKK